MEKEINNNINFFDLSIEKTHKKLQLGIYRKAAINFLINRLNQYPLSHNDDRNDKYNLSGVYQIQCANCPLKYVGQTGRTFKVRFREHIRDIKSNGQSSKVAQHALDTTHGYSTTDKILEVLYIGKKGRTLDTYERFHIYETSKLNL
ncbi:hypothetical protein B7P43_G02713 [Cryptotermes secundus]|uniref:GIY-YIG domain-containing protein n=1 Tax=Cryptotermes secundus TaxID=105785 RepID=A0A2J7RQF2_9NEOP|nr:hypothetical protein B7P43_G02713 [Cryptotermes secundus]